MLLLFSASAPFAGSASQAFGAWLQFCNTSPQLVTPQVRREPHTGGAERFFVVDVYCGDTGSKERFACVQPKDTSQRFAGLHFGRDLLAAALGTPGRAHWKACEVGRSDEERLVAAFKAMNPCHCPSKSA